MESLVVESHLRHQAVVAKHFSVVRCDDHRCVVSQSRVIKSVQESANLVVNFVDQPGLAVGTSAEEAATLRRGVSAIAALYQIRVPYFAVIVRRVFGVGGAAMVDCGTPNVRVACPSGDWGSLPLEGGVEAAYRRALDEAEDREALLFASRCLADEPLLVRHGLGVAVHLLDFARAQSMPHALCKALAAAAMVHDLGKALLPRELLALPVLDARQHRWLQGHVPMLLQRIDRCGWLSTPVVEAVVRDINERLDGSGYPNHRGGADLSELARLASVVDVVDILSRQRPGREPWSTEDIHAWLERNSARFDPQWVARYRAHFGRWPVGCLVRYADGLLGRVAALDERGLPSRVRLRAEDGGWLDGEALARHGEPEATVPAPAD